MLDTKSMLDTGFHRYGETAKSLNRWKFASFACMIIGNSNGGSCLNIKLTFLGAAGNVAGSRYLVEANNARILVDCGLYQERDLSGRNWEAFPVPPESIDAIVLTHAHTDHCGLLPKLVRDGFRGNVYSTEATCEIAAIILEDSAHLQEEDAAYKQKRHEREKRKGVHPEVPLYTVEDARACAPLFKESEYGEYVRIADGIEVDFHDAGHVLGSSMARLTITQGPEVRTIVFSGDVGRFDKPILPDPSVFTKVDYILIESTYGDRIHQETPSVRDSVEEIVNTTWKAGGNIIIPSFALQRAQEVLYHLNALLMQNRIPHTTVFLDSPMAIKVTEVYKRHAELMDQEMQHLITNHQSPFDFPGLKMVESADESRALNMITGTVIIIAGSGMCTGGRIKHHLVTNITRTESTILFVGYQAVGTLGRQIIDGAEQVRILGQHYPVKAKIIHLGGFSSHADRDDLDRWLSALQRPPRTLFVVHGEPDVAHNFANHIRGDKGWNVVVPKYMEAALLD